MATPTTTAPSSGVMASISGVFSDLVKQATPVVDSYLQYRTARETAKTSAQPATPAAGPASQAALNAQASVPLTSRPWFWPVVAGGALLLGLLGFLALRPRGK